MRQREHRSGVMSGVRSELESIGSWLLWVAIFSAFISVLYLAGTLYMLQVYDRVLTSRSLPTLLALSAIAFAAYLFQGIIDAVRVRMLARIGARFEQMLSPRAYAMTVELPVRGSPDQRDVAPISDLDQVRSFLAGLGPAALFDLPFAPLFIIVAFLLHPWLGWFALLGAVLVVAVAACTEMQSRAPARAFSAIALERQALIDATRRNAEVICALGMRQAFAGRYREINDRLAGQALRTSDVVSATGALAKTLRLVLQSGAIGLGAYLAITGAISGGAIIAASILTARALAPIEAAILHWKGFIAARQALGRLDRDLAVHPTGKREFALPAPEARLEVENLVVAPPGASLPVLKGISLQLSAGDALGIIGPTGSGKSTLARALVGVWPPAMGTLRLDGADLAQWGDGLGRHIGYLPQDIELFEGTVAQNIARFRNFTGSAAIIAAARAAAAHDLILGLPHGYETQIGPSGVLLSGGQRQRIALARALFGDPFLIVLDEPNGNLDREGDEALSKAIASVRSRGGIVVIITHRPSGLASVNLVALLDGGRITMLGARDEIIRALTRPASPPAPAGHVRPTFA